jgi:cell division protein FtsB
MVDETTPTFLEQVKAERAELEKLRDEIRQEKKEIQELRAVEILSGKTDAGADNTEKPAEKSAVDYAKDALKGKI